MSTAGAPDLGPGSAQALVIEGEGTEGDTLAWDKWLQALEDDEPVILRRPASFYLHEARSAGEG
ncbi:MAG: hypothetical protein ACRDZY_02990 [Acidimicrobiales bacterium]